MKNLYAKLPIENRFWQYFIHKDGYVINKRKTGEYIKSPWLTNSGYLQCMIIESSINKRHHLYIHRLVAEYFIGKIGDWMEVNHINGVKTDNRLENLEILSKSDNMKHAYTLTRKSKMKLSPEIAKSIRLEYVPRKNTCKKLAEKYWVTPMVISRIVNFKQQCYS